VAIGLLAATVSTHLLLRQSLEARIDEQLAQLAQYSERSLLGDPGPRPGTGGRGGGPSKGPGGPDGSASLPASYVAKLGPDGEVLDYQASNLGEEASPPDLPAGLPGSSGGGDDPELFDAQSGSGSFRYRALAFPAEGGGTMVVALSRADADATLARLVAVEALVSLVVLVAAAILALWLVRLGLSPLTRMEQTAAEIAAGDLSRRGPEDSSTEIGRLGGALNRMMERIESAFEEQRASENRLRRFIADASHELRTPLTSIRGYAELFRSGAGADPEVVAKSMQRIEDESKRMGKLVEELLLLARLDQNPQLEMAPVDLASVARDAVQDALAVQPDRPIELDASKPVVVAGDEARLRQVAANLVSNALQHAPESTAVCVTVSVRGDEAILEVADEGPGLTPEQAAKVFDRFFRVDEGRARSDGGAGLGLSIVWAIVKAHGGRVWLETEPGAGARFFVALQTMAETDSQVSLR
jgi:two-component system OmpR family sensor kinase